MPFQSGVATAASQPASEADTGHSHDYMSDALAVTVKFREVGLAYFQRRTMGNIFKDRSMERQKEAWSLVDASSRAVHQSPVYRVVYMFAAMTSIIVWQMYIVTFIITLLAAIISMRWFWVKVFPIFAPIVLALAIILVLSTFVINM